MTFRTIITDNAKYILQLMDHDLDKNYASAMDSNNRGLSRVSGLDLELFNNIDGLVFEEHSGNLAAVINQFLNTPDLRIFFGHPVRPIVEQAFNRKIPVYCTDVPLKEPEHPSEMHEGYYAEFDEFCKVYPVHSTTRLETMVMRMITEMFYEQMCPSVEGRNAVNAEKIERWVAPRVQMRTGRKPLMGLVFGFGHAGLEVDLKNPERRKKVIEIMKKCPEFDAKKFDLAQEAIDLGHIIQTKTLNTYCFI